MRVGGREREGARVGGHKVRESEREGKKVNERG